MHATITSVKDPRIALVRELSTGARRRAHRQCVLTGEQLIGQAVDMGAQLDFVLYTDSDRPPSSSNAVPVTATVLKQALRSQKPISMVAVAALPEERERPTGEFAVVLDQVADPGNLGTIVRTACGLGATDVVLADPDTDLTSRRVLEASRASVLGANITRYRSIDETMTSLHDHGFEIVATSPRGRTLQSLTPLSGAPVALVIGNETDGVGAQTLAAADHVVRIPMAESVESLNVGVAAGISISELRAGWIHASLPRRSREIELTDAARIRLDAVSHVDTAQFEELLTKARSDDLTDAESRLLAALWPEVFAS